MTPGHLSRYLQSSPRNNTSSFSEGISFAQFTLPSCYEKQTIDSYTSTGEMSKDLMFSTLQKFNESNMKRVHPRVYLDKNMSQALATHPSPPSDFALSPASESSAEDETVVTPNFPSNTVGNSDTRLAPPELHQRVRQSQVSTSIESSVVSTPIPTSCPPSPRRSPRKPKPKRRDSGEEITDGLRNSGPATRLRNKRHGLSDNDEDYYLSRVAPIPKVEAPYPARPIITPEDLDIDLDMQPIPANPKYPIPISKQQVVDKWDIIQRKTFLASYLRHGKDFHKIGAVCHKTMKETVEYYYLIKHDPEFRKAKNIRREIERYKVNLVKIEPHMRSLAKMTTNMMNPQKKGKGRRRKGGRY